MRRLPDTRCCIPVDCSFHGLKIDCYRSTAIGQTKQRSHYSKYLFTVVHGEKLFKTGISNHAENPDIFKFNTANVWDCWSDEEMKWKRERYAGWAQLPERGFENGYTLNIHIPFRMENSILRNHWVKTWLVIKNTVNLLCNAPDFSPPNWWASNVKMH